MAGSPSSRARRIMGRIPFTGRRDPSKASSPANTGMGSGSFTYFLAASTPRAMGRSSPAPSFFRSAGARFTVMWVSGNRKSEFFTAAFTRSRASFTAVSGSPTISKAGMPLVTSTSTVTISPLIPRVVSPQVRAYMESAPLSCIVSRSSCVVCRDWRNHRFLHPKPPTLASIGS